MPIYAGLAIARRQYVTVGVHRGASHVFRFRLERDRGAFLRDTARIMILQKQQFSLTTIKALAIEK